MEPTSFFDDGVWTDWRLHWIGMPEFVQEDLSPWKSMLVHFKSEAALKAFGELLDQRVTPRTRSIWFPGAEIGRLADKRYVGGKNPRHPVYVISKGRWKSRLTVKSLEKCGVPYRVVVEPQEHGEYAKVIDPANILVLPFSNLGQGSIPARNWVWDHAVESGASWHWILDDNIRGFYRLNRNYKVPVRTGATFRAVERFVDRYENVGQAGFNYFMFAPRKDKVPALYLNTRIYSCILIRNDLPFRWRGRYNEDTDLSLRILKSGLCTVLFNAFLAMKQTTMTMKGGNTDELYQQDGREKMAQSLLEQHPGITTITEKWGRCQHQVYYRRFKSNRLKLKEGVVLRDGVNEMGMVYEELMNNEWAPVERRGP